MNNFIETQAEHLWRITRGNNHSPHDLNLQIQNHLKHFNSANDKIEFLNFYKTFMDNEYSEHRKKCDKDNCMYSNTNHAVKFYVNQSIEKVKKDEEKERFWRYGTLIENLTINGSGQIMNFGTVEGDINQNLKILNETGNVDISKSIEELVVAIKESDEIQEQDKKEYLDHLKTLSEQALKPKEERLPTSTLKTIVQYGLGALSTFDSLASVTGINLLIIAEYFFKK